MKSPTGIGVILALLLAIAVLAGCPRYHVYNQEMPGRGHFDAPNPEHHHGIGATGRSKADAPEIDGEVPVRDAGGLKPGDIVEVRIEDSDEHDLYGVPV